MSIPVGTGPYLLLIDYGSEGQSVHRFQTEQDLLDAVRSGQFGCGPLIFAKELSLSVSEDQA